MNSTLPSRSGGFTLIEIMVVVVILGILAAIVVPRVMDNPDKARVVTAKQQIRTIETALNMYRLDNFKYPTTDQGLEALVSAPADASVKNFKQGGYMPKLPNDPWGNPFQYLNPGTRGEIDIYSLGADGQPGGDGVDADIGSWDLN
ncbi:MAG: type II secretion system major pseudopilin GspG [Gammaproteobacteria bacterium]|nr:type II secretion system major pseudopilin GspG [Gammaproteobacteria bacterium]